jgi:uncharacterized repeat protein (TIGR03837 family)
MTSFDLFCKVIDNYGDIGVCWRLARQLANEHQQAVRLWVDDLNVLKTIWPNTQLAEQQLLNGVDVRLWKNPFDNSVQIADVVIEAFGCDISSTAISQMALRKNTAKPVVWINLEYLSAENWIEDCHLKTSIHPSTGLVKTFFFPSFSENTGGLLREKNITNRQKIFSAADWLKQLYVNHSKDELLISLFAYENPAIALMLKIWSQSPTPILCLVPPSKILHSIEQLLKRKLSIGDIYQQGSLRIQVIPFLNQIEYDHLLWTCDINFVRGEDSFVRAQLAGKPFIWHIYPQEESAHLIKLDAFLSKYMDEWSTEINLYVQNVWHFWNQADSTANENLIAKAWNNLIKNKALWQADTQKWNEKVQLQTDLTTQLLAFIKSQEVNK